MKLLFSVGLLLCFIVADAQSYTGVVYDSKSHESLPYVSIGVLNKGVGTVAQANGTFSITLPDEFNNDTLKFSMVGYKPLLFIVQQFKSKYAAGNIFIYMEEDMKYLSEVVIRPKNMKSVLLGNKYDKPTISAGFESDDLGSECGTVMRVKKGRTYYLKTAGFNIAKCEYDSILFRVNIYDFKDGRPGEILQSLPLYVKVIKDQKKILLDLTPYGITVENDFLLSLEWIMDLPDKRTSFMFCAGFAGNRIFFRKTSQDKWNSVPVCIGSFCVAEYQK